MSYIVWELISPYDGYGTQKCDTWQQALDIVKDLVMLYDSVQEEYEKWLRGEISSIKGHKLEIFVTSGYKYPGGKGE